MKDDDCDATIKMTRNEENKINGKLEEEIIEKILDAKVYDIIDDIYLKGYNKTMQTNCLFIR